jgi:hypothetical protein
VFTSATDETVSRYTCVYALASDRGPASVGSVGSVVVAEVSVVPGADDAVLQPASPAVRAAPPSARNRRRVDVSRGILGLT